jgi:hypothetical protein
MGSSIDRSLASRYIFDKESSVTLLLLLLYTQTNKQCVHIHHNMAPRTAVSRKRDRRKMMREAELRRQVQDRQQHPNNIGDTGIMMASPPGSQGQAGLAGLLHTGHQSTSETLAERDGEDGTEEWRRKQQQQQQQNWNESQHPPDCPCILRKLARDDLFLPPSLRIQEDISDTNNDKA